MTRKEKLISDSNKNRDWGEMPSRLRCGTDERDDIFQEVVEYVRNASLDEEIQQRHLKTIPKRKYDLPPLCTSSLRFPGMAPNFPKTLSTLAF